MKIINKNIWNIHKEGCIVCITTNGVTKPNTELVMGRGVALQAKQIFPDISYKLGNLVRKNGNHCFFLEQERVISFPTKNHWKNKSEVSLIKRSCLELNDIIEQNNLDAVYLPKPGCSNGGLNWEFVKKQIENILFQNVIIVDKSI